MSNRAQTPEPEDPPGFFGRLRKFLGPAPSSDEFPAVSTASSRAEAELIAGFLRNEGIKAIVLADDEAGLNPALQTGRRIRILVPRAQHSRAKDLLDKNQ